MNNTKRIHAGTDRTRANDATLRRRLMLSASVLVASVGGYARSAQADCNPQGGGTYLCTGATVTPQVFFYGGDVTVTTDPTFSANVAGGDALRFVGDGTVSFEDLNASSIIATTGNGIYLANGGAGGTTITATGDVVAGDIGIGAINFVGGDITINSQSTVDATYGIGGYSINGSGSVSITSNGNVTAQYGAVGGVTFNGDVSIESTGTVTSANGRGIAAFAGNYGGTGNTAISSTGDVSAQYTAIGSYAYTGNVSVASEGNVTSANASAIIASVGFGGSGDAVVTSVGRIDADVDGIFAYTPDGDVRITSAGDVSASSGVGVGARVGGTGDIAITSNGTIDSEFQSLFARTQQGDITIASVGDVATQAGDAVYAGTVAGNVSIVSTGDVLRAQFDGIEARTTAGNVSITSTGNINANREGLQVFTRDGNATVVSEGNITSGRVGISLYSDTGDTTLSTTGDITAAQDGILASSFGANGTATILVDGSVNANDRYGIAARANDVAIDLADGSSVVSNAGIGVIFGRSDTGAPVGVLTVGNSSIVRGGSRLAVIDSDGMGAYARNTTITNSGLIDGNILLGAGNDRFELRPGGEVTGGIDGGADFDVFTLGGESDGPGIDGSIDVSNVDFDNDGATATGLVGLTGFELLEKRGTSTFEITGTSDESGFVQVLEGGLIVNASLANVNVDAAGGTVLGGTGTIGAFNTNGAVSPGSLNGDGTSTLGTLTVNGDVTFFGGSALAVDIAPGGEADLLDASGTVFIQDADVVVSTDAAVGAFGDNEEFVIVQAGGGVDGTFSSVIEDIPDISLEAVYDPNSVTLVASLDADLSPQFAAPGALAGGIVLGDAFLGALLSQATPLGGVGGGTEFTLSSGGAARPLDAALGGSLVAGAGSHGAQTYAADVIALDAAPASNLNSFAIVGGKFGGTIDVDDQDGRTGYDADTLGAFVGVRGTTALGNGVLAYGALYGYSGTDVDVLGGEADIEAHQGGVFAGYAGGGLLASASAAYGDLAIETERALLNGARADGETDGHYVAAAAEVAYDIAPMIGTFGLDGLGVSPFVGLQGVHAEIDEFSERGSTVTVADDEVSVGFLRAGVRFDRTIAGERFIYRPTAMIGYELAFGDLDAATANDLGFGLDPLNIEIAGRDPSALLLGAGLTMVGDRFELSLDYETAISDDHTSHFGSIGLGVRF